MMETIPINNSKTGTGRDMMKVEKTRDSLLDRVITALYWENTSDRYMQRYMGLFELNHIKVSEHNKGGKIAVKLQKPDWPPMGKHSHPL